MKTISKYEPDDIDLKGNKAHSLILASLLVGNIIMTAKPNPGEELSQSIQRNAKDAVASVLSIFEESGYELVKKETVPAAFLEAFRS